MSYKTTGETGIPNGGTTDAYQDRDTYVLATGAQTNELTVRLTWEGTDADLDFLVLAVPQGANSPVPLAFGTSNGTSAPELATTAALKSSQYWVWVGQYDSATPTTKKSAGTRAETATVGASVTPIDSTHSSNETTKSASVRSPRA